MARKFGPMALDHPSIGQDCHACHKPFHAGDHTTLVPLGPGDDETARKKCESGKFYNAVAVEVHWDCAGTEHK